MEHEHRECDQQQRARQGNAEDRLGGDPRLTDPPARRSTRLPSRDRERLRLT
jgi:hypothetical protein